MDISFKSKQIDYISHSRYWKPWCGNNDISIVPGFHKIISINCTWLSLSFAKFAQAYYYSVPRRFPQDSGKETNYFIGKTGPYFECWAGHPWLNFQCQLINNGNRTEWSPVQFVIIPLSDNKIGRLRSRKSDLLITSMIYRLNWTTQFPVAN